MTDLQQQELFDWFRAAFTIDFFAGAAGGRVRFALQNREEAGGVVIVVTGRTEWLEKYLEVARDLQKSGCAICLYEHFGQGGSDRPLADPQKGHIDDFSFYVSDLITLVEQVIARYPEGPVILLAHSMGGAIATLALADRPGLADGLILVSPMLQINTGCLLPPLLGEVLAALACRFGGGGSYVWGGGPFRADQPFAGNDLTSDAERFARNQQMIVDRSELALGSPTFGWLRQAYRGMRRARGSGDRLNYPVLLLAGLDDTVVSVPAMLSLSRRLPRCTVKRYAGARHEVLMERDEVRSKAITEILVFIETLVSSADTAGSEGTDGRLS
ncbi:MAG: alpha/beta fold hydrolase [Desulfofustis sp.]|jgi:lysophospholipase|nr:alpha/beta fold hydrolase [Desulfofustis sp.]